VLPNSVVRTRHGLAAAVVGNVLVI